ncbi:protein clt2 [Anaeramoeba flamelloides]|uniref:Protein clt2 n=1 Tax=Anaeramoeba flamelloides TaxID=1746091 RepID=A0ABQ8YV68_9EUKA|nr:protein clt2 [Anaeramoeba flamelloides]
MYNKSLNQDLKRENKNEKEELIKKDTQKQKRKRTLYSTLPLIGYFVSYVSYQLLMKNVEIRTPDYPFTLTQANPFFGLLVYSAINLFLFALGKLPYKKRRFPKWKAIFIGVCFSMVNIFQNLGNRGNVVPGPFVLIILNLVVPISFLLDHFTPYSKKHSAIEWISLLTLIFGIIMSVWDQIRSTKKVSFSNDIGYMLLLAFANVPLAISMIFVQYQLKNKHPDLSVIYLWNWVCVFQFAMGVPFSFLNAYFQGIKMSNIWDNFVEGLRCDLAGYGHSPNNCQYVPYLLFTGILAGCAKNLSMAQATKVGSATLIWYVRTVALPTSALIFSLRFIMKKNATEFNYTQIFGLVIVVLSLLCYKYKPIIEIMKAKKKKFHQSRYVSSENGSDSSLVLNSSSSNSNSGLNSNSSSSSGSRSLSRSFPTSKKN